MRGRGAWVGPGCPAGSPACSRTRHLTPSASILVYKIMFRGAMSDGIGVDAVPPATQQCISRREAAVVT